MNEIAVMDSPVGAIRIELLDGKVRELAFVDEDVQEPSDRGVALVVQRLDAYFSGDATALDGIAVEPAGSPFQRSVWDAIARIPLGETVSYAKLAVEAGSPQAVRAAGTACGANPIALIIPCHRVVRADGSMGNYGGGIERKRWLLDHEEVIARSPR